MSLEGVIAANRFGLGAKPGEVAAVSGDPRAWLLAQLTPETELPQPGVVSSRVSRNSFAKLVDLLMVKESWGSGGAARLTAGGMSARSSATPQCAAVERDAGSRPSRSSSRSAAAGKQAAPNHRQPKNQISLSRLRRTLGPRNSRFG